MGWTVVPFSNRRQIIEELKKGWENAQYRVRCLAAQYKGGPGAGTLYAVFEHTYKDGSKPLERWARVALLRYYRQDSGWGYKDMDENMGPNERKCPLKYLQMLTPLPDDKAHEYAREWRADCEANWRKARIGRKLSKGLKDGDTFFSGATKYSFVSDVTAMSGCIVGRKEDGRMFSVQKSLVRAEAV